MKIYNNPNFNLKRTNINNAINDNFITGFTKSEEFIYLRINY